MRRRDVLKGIMGVLVAGPSCVDVLKVSDVPTVVFDPLGNTKGLTKGQLCELIEATLSDLPSFDPHWVYDNYEVCHIFRSDICSVA